MPKKRDLARKATHGMLVTLEETSKGNLSLVLDTVEKEEGSDSAQWTVDRNFTEHEYPSEMIEGFQLTRRELAEIGETLMIWLLSKDGRLND
ncbi:hypothetical protein M3P05_03925 [Sansalvadorimonas sp. 2012CJ34-2]|uniref:Uncharacterized protein n=1 Tax=Parendozoicomonas callyspongiae TaxID=2942213 RepID=A0ABT0PCI1_9GAMM|nr:hypothetical protein [Sansalvadorimonas sp. 2012CJ34-2]MCL6269090.1 hypothetical protein [Sansalvadorimonas sp. 2012CJ34-2]